MRPIDTFCVMELSKTRRTKGNQIPLQSEKSALKRRKYRRNKLFYI